MLLFIDKDDRIVVEPITSDEEEELRQLACDRVHLDFAKAELEEMDTQEERCLSSH